MGKELPEVYFVPEGKPGKDDNDGEIRWQPCKLALTIVGIKSLDNLINKLKLERDELVSDAQDVGEVFVSGLISLPEGNPEIKP